MSDSLVGWFDEAQTIFNSLKEKMISAFIERTERLCSMQKKAQGIFWWPFTQHKLVAEEAVTVIDSRCGEHFAVHKVHILLYVGHNTNSVLVLLGIARGFLLKIFLVKHNKIDGILLFS